MSSKILEFNIFSIKIEGMIIHEIRKNPTRINRTKT